ncbi:energy transducer TonB [Flavobacterium dauae]|uniref:energy transducer TonB n=1 Tax=Flavobacterium dauae TaxID=1563479 RepID=UPI00101B274B|nr:energy transducer TonB [Flavobacterium dauae]WLD23055.1 energy transducer TonB [Flavobacterium dauae]
MKNILLIILTLFAGLQVFAQEKGVIIQACGDPSYNYQAKKEDLIKDENYIYKLVQKKAQPKEGFDVFFKNLNINIKEELGDKVKRSSTLKYIKIKIRFVVEKDGSLTNMTIIEDKFDLANDVFQIIKEKSKWEPAELENKIVRMYFTLPIKIKLD